MSVIPKKSFGQNFLQDEALLERIALAICAFRPDAHTRIYEIGAGTGALTRALLTQGALVSAIERDRDLIPVLRETFREEIASGKLELHEANAVTFFEDFQGEPFVLSGNLPYHLSSSIFFETAKLWGKIHGAVFLIQKEVAERVAAGPNNRTYGLLSVLLQSRFEIKILEHVSRHAFWPPPKVESSVIELKPKSRIQAADWDQFVKVVKTAFLKRRKVLTNSLADYENIEAILERLGINPKSRAENLSFEDYERIVQCL